MMFLEFLCQSWHNTQRIWILQYSCMGGGMSQKVTIHIYSRKKTFSFIAVQDIFRACPRLSSELFLKLSFHFQPVDTGQYFYLLLTLNFCQDYNGLKQRFIIFHDSADCIDKLDLKKIEHLCSSKDLFNKTNKQAGYSLSDNICKHRTAKGLIPRIYDECPQPNNEKTNNPIKNGQSILTDTS